MNAGQLRAACLFPFVTSFDLAEVAKSTLIDDGAQTERPGVTVLAALRYSFFVDRDMALAKRYLDAATVSVRAKRDEHRAFIGEALDFVLSDEFKEF